MSEIELMAVSDLRLVYGEERRILSVRFMEGNSSLNQSQHAVHHCSITLTETYVNYPKLQQNALR